MAAAMEGSGSGASGSAAAGSATDAEPESAGFSPVADEFAAATAGKLKVDMNKTANAAVAIIRKLDLIFASRTARRDHASTASPFESGANGTSNPPHRPKNG
jgi:hypothetical protein